MRMRVVAAIALVSALIGAVAGVGAADVFDDGGNTAQVAAPTATPGGPGFTQGASLSTECLSAADIYEMVRPAVVEIISTVSGSFGQEGTGTGSGFVIDEDGHILTNYHVIEGAESIEVRFEGGDTAPVDVVGADPANDLAVIKVDPSGRDLTVADLGDSDALRVGNVVLAIGNPFSLEGTLTQGIVSALNRTYTEGSRPIREMIQTDAAVNPGNSGGPLINCHGEVVGINTLIENPSGDNVNVGVAFAVSINTAEESLGDMLAGETVSHPWLGIAGAGLTPAIAAGLGLEVDRGVYVTLVSAGSPAEDAGLRGAFPSEQAAAQSSDLVPGGDVILAVDGNEVTYIDDLASYLAEEKRPGDSVELEVLRDGETLTLTATLADWPS